MVVTSTMSVRSAASEPTMDTQHAIMSAAMLNAKRARMRVEADRQVLWPHRPIGWPKGPPTPPCALTGAHAPPQILANRIARLQSEEMKAVKRIEETHRRTQEILAVKMRQQQLEIERSDQAIAKDAALEEKRQIHAIEKQKHKQARIPCGPCPRWHRRRHSSDNVTCALSPVFRRPPRRRFWRRSKRRCSNGRCGRGS